MVSYLSTYVLNAFVSPECFCIRISPSLLFNVSTWYEACCAFNYWKVSQKGFTNTSLIIGFFQLVWVEFNLLVYPYKGSALFTMALAYTCSATHRSAGAPLLGTRSDCGHTLALHCQSSPAQSVKNSGSPLIKPTPISLSYNQVVNHLAQTSSRCVSCWFNICSRYI